MEESTQQLAADIAANVIKATAVSTARDLQIQKLEINYKTMSEQNSAEHGEIKKSLNHLADKLEEIVEKMDKKYAGKWVEKVLWSMGGIVGTVILIAIIELVVSR